MPYTRPDFDGALFNFRIFLKLVASTCLGPGASCPPPPCPLPPLSAALFNTTLNVLSNTQAMMDRQKKNELPRMQVQFFDNVGIPIFRVSQTVNWWFVKKREY